MRKNHLKMYVRALLYVQWQLMRSSLTLILLLSCVSVSFAERNSISQQQDKYTVKGLVLDERTNEPIIGAAIIIDGDGAKGGTTTDVDGNFELKVPHGTTKLVFQFLGYDTKSVAFYPNRLNMLRVVTMKEFIDELEEATVVAFGKQKKSSIVASITTVSPKDLKVPSSNLTTALAGRLAGLIAYQRSGEPGQDNADFFIRGVTTFGTGKSNPLILIDNIELTADDLARLSTDDIESFSILKDATATSLYGARGANGVIMVTTKEGEVGSATISARYETSISGATRNVELADPLTFMRMHNEAVRTRDPLGFVPYTEQEIALREQGANPYVYPIVDWKELMFKDFTQNHRFNMNLSGGGKISRYYVALSYARDNGILSVDPVNSFNNNITLDKFGVRSNINLNLTPTTKMDIRVHGTFDDYQGPISGGTDLYKKAIKSNPVLFPAVYAPDEKTKYNTHLLFGNNGGEGNYMNPYADMLRGYKEYNNTMVLAQLQLEQDLSAVTEGLNARVMGNTTRSSFFDVKRHYKPFYYSIGQYDKQTDVYSLEALNPTTGTDYLSYDQGEGQRTVSSTLYIEAALTYNRTFAEKHDASGMFVFTSRENLTGNAGTLHASLPGRNMGLAGRFTYGYDNRYFIEGNFGYNGSERFAKANRWGFFPSVGAGWMVSNERFWANNAVGSHIPKLKLKATYGMVGNDAISDDRFFYLSEVNMNDANRTYWFGDTYGYSKSGISIKRYADPNITWEIAYKLNLGFEINLFDKLEIQADYFRETRTNILQERKDIPSVIGLQSVPMANIGEAKSGGVDFSVDYSESFSEDLWVTFRGNFTYATSEFTVYEEPEYPNEPWLSKIGRNLSQPEGYIAERLFVDENEVANSPVQELGGEYMAGDIKYIDINGDGKINQLDKVPIGYPTIPEIIYGFGASIGYKDFDFSFFFQGSARSSFFVDPAAITPFKSDGKALNDKRGNNAVLKFIEDSHWTEANQNVNAAWPRLSETDIANNNVTSTWFLRSGNFLRLKNIELGYTFPEEMIHKIKMQNLRVYVSGSNLLNISSFKDWDAEMGGDGLGYPVQVVGNVGVQVTF